MKSKNFLIAFLFVCTLALFAYVQVISHQLKRARNEITTISIDPTILKEKLAKAPPEWMVRQIEGDLSPYRAGISSKMLDEAFHGRKIDTYHLIRFQIADRHLTFSHDEKHIYSRHFRELLACIKTLNEQTDLPDVDFIVSLQDGYEGNPDLGPCFVFAKREGLDSLILVPDIKAMTGYDKLRKAISAANGEFHWKDKRPKAFWRGSTTGGHFTKKSWDRFARSKLVILSQLHPSLIDARFHSVVQCDKDFPKMMKDQGLVGGIVKKGDHLKYKYLVDVDGNSCSFERYFWLLASNSVVLKQITPNIQWYYGALQPYVHYVPVQEDLSDLVDQIEWAKEHDAECERIANNASEFAEDHLSAEDTLVYLYHLLVRYSSCLKAL